MFRKYLYKIKQYCKNKYLILLEENSKYERPQIKYDKALKGYFSTDKVGNGIHFDIETLVEELCHDNFVFEYKIGSKWSHNHEFRRVIQNAYKYGRQFSVPEESKSDYSEQELRILKKVVEVGQSRINAYKKYLDENNMYDPEFIDEE